MSETNSDEIRLSKSTVSGWAKEAVRILVLVAAVLAGSAGGSAASAGETEDLRKQVVELDKRLSVLESRLNERKGGGE